MLLVFVFLNFFRKFCVLRVYVGKVHPTNYVGFVSAWWIGVGTSKTAFSGSEGRGDVTFVPPATAPPLGRRELEISVLIDLRNSPILWSRHLQACPEFSRYHGRFANQPSLQPFWRWPLALRAVAASSVCSTKGSGVLSRRCLHSKEYQPTAQFGAVCRRKNRRHKNVTPGDKKLRNKRDLETKVCSTRLRIPEVARKTRKTPARCSSWARSFSRSLKNRLVFQPPSLCGRSGAVRLSPGNE